MKPLAASAVTFVVVLCLLSTACSPPEEEKRNVRSSQSESPPPEERRPSPTIDPWKAASEWPVPNGPVGDAQRFLLSASAYQYTSEGADLITHQKSHGEARVVRDKAAEMESVEPHGRNGIITDGKREFVFFQGRYEEEHGDCAAALMGQLRESSLQSLLEQSETHTPFLGLEKVDGVEAEVYALTARQSGGPPMWAGENGHLRVWVAKNDHRLLKLERKESYRDRLNPNVTHVSIDTRTYHYDPSVKVTLPGP